MDIVKIGDRKIGKGEPCFIIAEAGVNHNGDVRIARKMIDAARAAGVDAVKFQTFKAEKVVTKDAEKASYQKATTGQAESQFDMIKRLELDAAAFVELANYSRKNGIMFLSSPFDMDSADVLEELGVPAYKVASGEINNFPFLRYISNKGKPIILSTGMASLGEIEEALDVLRKTSTKDIILLHCITSYPADISEANLNMIKSYRCAFKVPIGFSDHTEGIVTPIAAVALGASVVEKHFTLDKSMTGPDHKASLEPSELKSMVTSIRQVEKALGTGIRELTDTEKEIKLIARRSLVAKVDIPPGIKIAEDMIDIKRPGTGLEPRYLDCVIGRIATVKIKKDELISLSKLA